MRNLLSNKSRGWIIGFTAMIIFMVSLGDYLTGWEATFTFWYLIPIAIASWHLGKKSGLLIAFICAALCLTIDLYLNSHIRLSVRIWNASSELSIFLLHVYLVSLLRLRIVQVEKFSRLDTLTGILNRRAFQAVVEQEIERMKRTNQPITLAYLDVDNFKRLNDQFGHNAGDRILKAIAETLQSSIRTIDSAARLGGDEFAIIFANSGEQVEEILDRIYHNLRQQISKHYAFIDFSIGSITFLEPPTNYEMMLEIVDRQMYCVKNDHKTLSALH
jgi:diguanylate cyclase (GGDEF)-like protein